MRMGMRRAVHIPRKADFASVSRLRLLDVESTAGEARKPAQG
jgi:hypothetical protein